VYLTKGANNLMIRTDGKVNSKIDYMRIADRGTDFDLAAINDMDRATLRASLHSKAKKTTKAKAAL
jgi:hypothetical protein